MRETLPEAPDPVIAMAGDLIRTTLSTVGADFSEKERTAAEIEAWSEALADMFCAYLVSLGHRD